MAVALSKDVFETWRQGHDEKVNGIKDSVEKVLAAVEKDKEKQQEVNLQVEGRVATLEGYRRSDAVRLGVFATVISAVIGALGSFVAGR